MRMSVMPARAASSTTYWIVGLSMIGSISFGCALVAGRKRVPNPAAGITAFVIFMASPISRTARGVYGGGPPSAIAGREAALLWSAPVDLRQRKDAIRRLVLTRRNRLPAPERARRGLAVAEWLFSMPEVSRARVLLLFASFGAEVPTDSILERAFAAGARVLLPYVADSGTLRAAPIESPDDLAPGYRGIREPARRPPVDAEIADVAVVPGVAFDRLGHRLGFGGGFYDRFLGSLPRRILRIGIAFGVQIVEEVPAGPNDES